MGKGLENRAGPRRGERLVGRPIALGIAGEESSQGAWGDGVNVSSGVQEIPHLLIFCVSLYDSSEPRATHPSLSPSDGLGEKLKLHCVFCLFFGGGRGSPSQELSQVLEAVIFVGKHMVK